MATTRPRAWLRARREMLALGVIVLLAAGVRLFWALQPRVVWGDEPFYLWLGQSLLSGQGYQFFGLSGVHASPLLALLAAGIGRVAALFGATGPAALASGTVTLYIVCGAALVAPLSAIAWRMYGFVPALFTALVTAFYPALTGGVLLWGTMTEPLYLLLLAAGWWALLVALEEGRLGAYAMAGAFLGLAYLTRTEAIVYLMAGPLVGLVLYWVFGCKRTASAWVGVGALAAVFFAVISPYLIVLYEKTGVWQIVEEAGSTYVSAQGLALGSLKSFDAATWGLDPATGEVYYFSETSEQEGLLDAIKADPATFVRLLHTNLSDLERILISLRLLPWPFLAVIGLGLFARPWDGPRLRRELFLAASLVGIFSFLPFFIQDRYLATALIPALIWIGAGLAALSAWLAESFRAVFARPARGWAAALLVGVLCVAVLLVQTRQLRRVLSVTQSWQPGHVAAADVLHEIGVTPQTVIMSRYPAIAFHSGAAWTPTPAASWEEVLVYARAKGAQYLVMDEREAQWRPQLAFLLDPQQAPPELRYITTLGDEPRKVIIYAFR
ncbi:MAG: hypothetical protein BWY52_02664 [Chloroflexi bacterium ADurb.Bin325]|nr:MAG: hypothetical protein BWY52_02664 [Chloroflexi bacterium ADurb.Bin325]